MRRVKVLFIMPVMGMGGSERLVHNLVGRIDRSRFSPSVAWLNGAEALQEFQDLRVPLYHFPKTGRVDFTAMRKLSEIIRRESIDIVNAQHFMPLVYAYYGCRLVARKPLIFTAHSRWELEAASLKWRVAGGYLLRRIGASVGVAPDVTGAIRSVFGLKASQTVTIENGVDVDLFACKKDDRGLRASLRLADGDMLIGIVANLKRVKNHLFLLRAFARLAEEYENVKLLIIGQGYSGEADNTEDELRLFVKRHGLSERVLFLGHRTDIPELLQLLDVFCLVSVREGLPISLIEAMAAGLPTVATNVEGIRDAITRNEEGVLVELDDVVALKEALARLIRDPEWRLRLGRAGRERAVQKYSLQRCVREYEQLFLSVLNASATR